MNDIPVKDVAPLFDPAGEHSAVGGRFVRTAMHQTWTQTGAAQIESDVGALASDLDHWVVFTEPGGIH